MKVLSQREFYEEIAVTFDKDVTTLLPPDIAQQTGHFNLLNLADLPPQDDKPPILYGRRACYVVSLMHGHCQLKYADAVVDIKQPVLFFSSPREAYRWQNITPYMAGYLCIFTADFLRPATSGVEQDEWPLFQSNSLPIMPLTEGEYATTAALFQKMAQELTSTYAYKYDLLRVHLMEMLHFAQKRRPLPLRVGPPTASARVSMLFKELLERQFPLHPPQSLQLRSATDYATQLAVHVNHLNKILKETTGYTTTDLLNHRLAQEARRLLRQTSWSISAIAQCLGFAEVAHFSNFFKRHTSLSPLAFRRAEKRLVEGGEIR